MFNNSLSLYKPIPVAARLLGMWVRIPLGTWMSVSCECCVLSGWSLVQRSRTKCGVSECDRDFSIMRRVWPTGGYCTMVKKKLFGVRGR